MFIYSIDSDSVFSNEIPEEHKRLFEHENLLKKRESIEWLNESLLTITSENTNQNGIYRYSFHVITPVFNLLTNELLACVTTDIYEKTLFDLHKGMNTKHRECYIADQEGAIVSAKDKKTFEI